MFSFGLALFSLGLAFEWMIKKRIMRGSASGAAAGGGGGRGGGSSKLVKPYSWIAWISTFAGSLLISATVGNPFGIHPLWALCIIIAGGAFVLIDIKDGRPDLPAFVVIALLPFVLRIPGAQMHTIITAATGAVVQLVHGISQMVGG